MSVELYRNIIDNYLKLVTKNKWKKLIYVYLAVWAEWVSN
jgi:hypothetical protein